MPSVSQLDSPPSSPRSPPRKRTKFSLKLKGKKRAASETSDREKREKLFPIFSSPAGQNASDDDNFEPPRPPPPHAGLRNHGNICYANAVLQVLRHCPGLMESIVELDSLVKEVFPAEAKSRVTEAGENEDGSEDLELCSGEDHKSVACGLKELFSQMKDLEQDYSENKENCEHLIQRKNTLVLAAKPLDFMQKFRSQNPMFEDNLQHDAQEFLCSLLVNLQDTEREIKKKMEDAEKLCNGNQSNFVENVTASKSSANGARHCCSPLEDLFHGQLCHQTKCMTCEDAKKRFENFLDVSVPVQKEPKVYDPKAFSPTPKKGQDTQSLCWALSQFARVEHLSGENKYFCENCLTHTEAEISTSFDKLPRILTIHLKRFTANAPSGFSGLVSKITTNLETPLELSITEWCSKTSSIHNPTYQLFGIVMHSGMTSCSGHYQAYVKVAMATDADLNNNNGQSIHHDKKSANNSKVDTNIEMSGKHETGSVSNTSNGTSVSCNTFSRDDNSSEAEGMTSSVEESGEQSPQSSAEKAKTTCISGITRYFHRTRKHSAKETKENQEVQNGDLSAAGEKLRHHSTPTYSYYGNNRSVNKIQSFRYHGDRSSRSAIRQLNFQDSQKQQGGECQNSAHVDEMSHHCARQPRTQTHQWIHFDDAEVAVLEESDVTALLSSSESSFTSPYLLFYKLAEP